MVARVLSFIRGSDAGAARTTDPALNVNAYAVAEDIELTLVLKDHGVELGLRDTVCRGERIAGVDVPAATPTTDLRALIGSGVAILAVAEDLTARGLDPADLLEGIDVVEAEGLARLVTDHDVTLSTTS